MHHLLHHLNSLLDLPVIPSGDGKYNHAYHSLNYCVTQTGKRTARRQAEEENGVSVGLFEGDLKGEQGVTVPITDPPDCSCSCRGPKAPPPLERNATALHLPYLPPVP